MGSNAFSPTLDSPNAPENVWVYAYACACTHTFSITKNPLYRLEVKERGKKTKKDKNYPWKYMCVHLFIHKKDEYLHRLEVIMVN